MKFEWDDAKRLANNTLLTDWARVEAMSDEEIDFSDCPEVTDEMFAKAVVRRGAKPVPVRAKITLQIDKDILIWLKAQTPHYQKQINALLRAYMESQQQIA